MRVIWVRSCGECPYYDFGTCEQLERDTDEDEIPQDCPLEVV